MTDRRVPDDPSTQDDWERVLSASAHLQSIIPDAVLVAGTASAMHAHHRLSRDDDHVVAGFTERFDKILANLEKAAGWSTARFNRPVLILGTLDGVETGVRNLIRKEPLETEIRETEFGPIVLPTRSEMLRIKAYLIVRRNTTRDYIDFVALADLTEQGHELGALFAALAPLDRLYPQTNGESVIMQLVKQCSEPKPADLGDGNLRNYRMIADKWKSWDAVKAVSQRLAVEIFRRFEPIDYQ